MARLFVEVRWWYNKDIDMKTMLRISRTLTMLIVILVTFNICTRLLPLTSAQPLEGAPSRLGPKEGRAVRQELLVHMGLQEGDLGPGTEAPLPVYVQRMYEVLEAADPLPWRVGQKTVLAATLAELYQNQTDVTFSFIMEPKRLKHPFTGVELVLPVRIAEMLDISDVTWACVSGGKCGNVEFGGRKGPPASTGWKVLDLTSLMKHYLDSTQTDRLTIPIIISLKRDSSEKGIPDLKPIEDSEDSVQLVLYSPYPGMVSLTAAFQDLKTTTPQKSPAPSPPRFRRDGDGDDADDASPCRVIPWRVSMEEMDWQHVVKRPAFLETNYCSGTCREPLDLRIVNATNHAYVRSLYRSRFNEADVPPSLCVPTRFKPITMVFNHGFGITTSKRQDDVSVSECSCM